MCGIEDAIILSDAVKLLLERKDWEARIELLRLSITDPVARPTVSQAAATKQPVHVIRPSTDPVSLARILNRDGWRCRYCGRKLVVAGVIELLGTLCHAEFPFPAGHHMPAARTHPAAIRVYPFVDHVHAGSVGGDWKDEANLVAACSVCNESKGNRLGWAPAAFESDGWNGLTTSYRALAERADATRPYHSRWMRALGV